MERIDKIFTALAAVFLIGVLVRAHRPRVVPERLNTSALPDCSDGPAYLLSALPRWRQSDDYDAPTSLFEPGDARLVT